MTEARTAVFALFRRARRAVPTLTVLLFAALALMGLLEIVGPCVWDPVELDLAELAKNGQTPPAELAFATRAVGAAFRLLGVSAWAGRIPMLLLSLVGAYAAFAFARRFGAKGASYFVLLVLATAPAYVLPSRVIGPQIGSVVAAVVAFAALATATFAPGSASLGVARGIGRARRIALFAVALLAATACAWSRGALVGVGVPALAVGLSALLHGRSAVRGESPDATTRALQLRGASLVAIAVLVSAAALAAFVLPRAPHAFSVAMLGPEHAAHKAPSFEVAWSAIGTSLFPWSAVLPLALAALSRRAPRGIDPGPRTALAAWVCIALLVHGALAQRDETAPFVAIGGLALVLGMALAELDARVLLPWSGRVMSVLTLTVVAYLAYDEVTRAPAKALLAVTTHPLGPLGAAMEKDVTSAFRLAATVLVGLALTPVLATALADLSTLKVRRERLPPSFIAVLRAAAARPGTFLLAGGLLGGLALRVGLYPRMLRSFAPDTALSVFAEKARPGERLGLFGVSQRTLAYVHDAPTATLAIGNATEAVTLLEPVALPAAEAGAGPAPRDFVALTQKDLPAVNALYRRQHGTNVPILGGAQWKGTGTGYSSDTVLLAASALRPGETNTNPIGSVFPDRPPTMPRALDADFGGKLATLGWELSTDEGARLDHMPPRGSFHVKIALRVEDAPGAGYCTFIHLEHSPTRMTAEHKDFATYPMTLWQRGDVVIDDFAIKLSPQLGAGRYTLYYGVGLLPCEDDRRLTVTRGSTDGHDRVRAGDVEVR